jgi:hypothetical protein
MEESVKTNPPDEQYRQTLEALADVDAGRVVDHRIVQTWADSLGSSVPKLFPRRRVKARKRTL